MINKNNVLKEDKMNNPTTNNQFSIPTPGLDCTFCGVQIDDCTCDDGLSARDQGSFTFSDYAYGEDSLTSCCNSYATYIEDESCCRNCRNTVSEDEG